MEPRSDIWIPRTVVGGLVLVVSATVIAGTVLAIQGHEIPPFLAGIGTSAVSVIGTLASVFFRAPGNGAGNGAEAGNGRGKPPI